MELLLCKEHCFPRTCYGLQVWAKKAMTVEVEEATLKEGIVKEYLMVNVTPRAVPKLQEMKREAEEGQVFRIVFRGFG